MCSVTCATASPSTASTIANSRTPRALGQNLRVAGVVQAGRVQTLLVQRGRHDAVGGAGHRLVDGPAEEVVGRPAGRGADAARLTPDRS